MKAIAKNCELTPFEISPEVRGVVFITFFYISRRKYWFRANFRFPVFDGFARFGMS